MVKGETYDKQLFESEEFRHFINIFLNKQDGITKGCTLEKDSEAITVNKGKFCIQGGFLKETTGTRNIIPTEAGYYKLIYEIDLSKTNTKDAFNQGNYKFIKALGEYPNLIQEDLENNGKIYQFAFCQFRITETGLQDFKDIRQFIDYGIYVRKNEKGYFIGWNNNNQEISRGDDYQILLNAEESSGDYFSIFDNGKIKVLKDCTTYIVSKIFIDKSAGEGYVLSKIKVNGNIVSNSLERIIERDYTNCIDSGTICKLKAGDIITLTVDYTSHSGNPVIRTGKSFSSISIFTV